MPATLLQREDGDGWAVLRMSSRSGLNKLGTRTLHALKSALDEALTDPSVRCVGIAGVGGSFAVGANLRELLALTPSTARAFSDLGNGIFRLCERSPAAVVAGVDGFCLGGGLDLALAADWRVATARSVFGHPGADLGLITGFGGTQRLSRLVGARRALRWLMTAERLPAAQAHAAGLVQEVCPDAEFEARFFARVRTMAALPAGALAAVKLGLASPCTALGL